jgi:uncharacterized protein (DUF302 family)
MGYAMSRTLDAPYEIAVSKVTEELKREGFGILTQIDVKETLRKKLGVDFMRYVILGACNPPFAYRALQAETAIGLMLPCNVIVYEPGPGTTVVSAIDPAAAMSMVDNDDLKELAEQVRAKLKRVVDSL